MYIHVLDIKLGRHFETLIVMLKFMLFSFFLIMEAFSTYYVTLLLTVFTSSCHYTNSFLLSFNLSINTKFKKKMYNSFFKGRFTV